MKPPVAKGRNDERAGAASPPASAVDERNYRSHEAKSPDSDGIRRWTRGRDWRWLEGFRELELRHDAGGSVWRSFGVIRRHSAIALFAFIAWGCAHRTHPERNVMLATAECDVASPDTVGSAPVIPARRAPPLPFGAIVGAVADSASGLKIGYSDIMVRRLDQPSDSLLFPTDPRGGFAVDSLMPGTYHIRARAFNHRFATRDVHVSAARVDTVRIALQYYSCVGY